MDSNSPLIDRVRLRSNQWSRLRSIVLNLATTDGFYARKFREAGVRTTSMNRVQDFMQQVPFTTKDELLADHLAYPPFGSLLTKPLAHYTRFCQTSGTSSGQPMAWLDTAESWGAMLACWRRVYEGADLIKGRDRIFFAFSFGPFLGFWTAYEAATRDFIAIPGGAPAGTRLLVTNALGQQVDTDAQLTTDAIYLRNTQLPSGLYFFALHRDGTVVGQGRFVKQ